jgi:transcriptional regulator with XRE-family HTH domain
MIRSQPMTYAQGETPNSIRAALGAVIRSRREDAERSLAALAEAADMSTAYLSEVERGLKDISTDKLVAIARALDLPVADLYLELAQRLGSRDAQLQRRSWPDDPRLQLRMAAASLRPHALRSVADFSLYLASTQAAPPKRRIGFSINPREIPRP